MNIINMIGTKFGKLNVICRSEKTNKNQAIMWDCKCDCGNLTTVTGTYIRNGHTTSCGSCPTNIYHERDGVIVGTDGKGREFIFDKEHLELVKQYNWYVSKSRVRTTSIPSIFLHRLIMNVEDDCVVDHINNNTLDNRTCNLRVCTQRENTYNQSLRELNTSGYKGVSYHKLRNKYRAYIKYNYKHIYLGLYDNAIDAAKAYNNRAIELYGQYANLNEI